MALKQWCSVLTSLSHTLHGTVADACAAGCSKGLQNPGQQTWHRFADGMDDRIRLYSTQAWAWDQGW